MFDPHLGIKCCPPGHKSETWQPISANVNIENAANVEQIVERFLRPATARTHLPMILAVQETMSWDVENLSLSGLVFFKWLVHHTPRVRSNL